MMKEEVKPKQVNLRIREGEQFYANEVSINFNPNEVILDFKCLTPTHDLGDHRSILVKHSVIMLNPFHAKSFLVMLNKAVKDYESRFGEIKKSEAMKKAEKLVKKDKKVKPEPKAKGQLDTFFG